MQCDLLEADQREYIDVLYTLWADSIEMNNRKEIWIYFYAKHDFFCPRVCHTVDKRRYMHWPGNSQYR